MKYCGSSFKRFIGSNEVGTGGEQGRVKGQTVGCEVDNSL